MKNAGQCTGKAVFSGVFLTLNTSTPAEAEKFFAALGQGGKVTMPMNETFFAHRFGTVADKFGVNWMVLAPKAILIRFFDAYPVLLSSALPLLSSAASASPVAATTSTARSCRRTRPRSRTWRSNAMRTGRSGGRVHMSGIIGQYLDYIATFPDFSETSAVLRKSTLNMPPT